MELLLGLQINSEMAMPITLNGITLKTRVEELKQEAARKWNVPKNSLGKIIWCFVLEDVFLLHGLDFLLF